MSAWVEIATDCEAPRSPILVNRSERRFFHVGCNKWKCRGCARRKSKVIQKRALLMQPTHMLTFSLRRAAGAEDLPELHEKRRVFFQYLSARRHPRWGMEKFFWHRETGDLNGQLHMHCLVRMRGGSFLPYKQIQAAAARIGLGVPDFQRIWRQEQAARYVAKYVTKSDQPENSSSAKANGEGSGLDQTLRPRRHARGCCGAPRSPRRFGMSIGLTLPPNPAWELATRADDLPVPWSPLILVLAAPMYAIPSG